MSELFPGQREIRTRLDRDAGFHMIVQLVYRSLESGDASIQDWRDAVNYAATEYHMRHIGPIVFQPEVRT